MQSDSVVTSLLRRHPTLTYRKLDYWVTKGFLKPTGGGGTGNPRSWPHTEIKVLELMTRLTAAGLTVEAAHRVARGQRTLAPGVEIRLDEERNSR